MSKTIILIVLFAKFGFGQENIIINFRPLTIEDYDLFIKEVLEQNGYKVKINYNADSTVRSGLTLDYMIANRKFGGVFDTISFQLFNNKDLVRNYEKKLSIFTIGKKPQIINGLNEVFNQVFSHTNSLTKKKSGYWNIPFTILKLDSSSYYIIAKAPGMYSQKEVEEAFFNMSKKYFEYFSYYSKSIGYNYSAPGPIVTYHSAYMVGGIITRNEKNEILKMDIEPKMLDHLIKLTAHFKH